MGNDRDWEALVEKYYEPIYRYCFHMSKTAADAEDATQQTFLKAHQKRSALDSIENEKAWLYRIARNTCIDRLRKLKRAIVALTEGLEPSYTPTLDIVGTKLRELIEALPQKQREVFILRHLHDFSTAETAEFLRIRPGSVKAHLKRAVDRLKAEFTGE
ncbi:MAG: RNA polymerase sigma factor [Bdellovibrionales bacterium]|nr:RNA polymerase sigma factor [Bdellovibrionales bacterium]